MKKVLLTFLVILFTGMSANAGQLFFTGGVPTHYSSGYGVSRSVHRYGTNAAYTPYNRTMTARRNREVRRYKAVTRAIQTGAYNQSRVGYNGYGGGYSGAYRAQSAASAEPMSRLNKNYTIKTQKSYTRDGITYYN